MPTNNKALRFVAPKFMPVSGVGFNFVDYVALAAAPAVNDTCDFLIPAGVDIASVQIQCDQLDTNAGKTVAFEVGYTPADPASSLTPVLNYFAPTGQTTAQLGGRLQCSFHPISFQEDVIVRLTFTAVAATFQAGSIYAIVSGNCNGPK